MEYIIKYIGPILGIASAIITIVAFYKNKIKHNVYLLASSLIFASIIVVVWDKNQKKDYDFELLEQKQKYEAMIESKEKEIIAQDAKSIADSVVISGWEDYGDYIAYLSTMVGFYKRHPHLYEEEYINLNRQLQEWQEDLRAIRKSGRSIFSSDYDGLKGLVNSTRDYLEQIGKSPNNGVNLTAGTSAALKR